MKRFGMLLAALTLWTSSADVRAQSVEEFYSKNTLTIISAFNAGGSNDVYCRAIARFIGKHIPGKPNVIVQNMPGAATIKATNYIWSVAPKDGTVIGNIQRTVALHTILDKDKYDFDIRKFTWLGSSSASPTMLMFCSPGRMPTPRPSKISARKTASR